MSKKTLVLRVRLTESENRYLVKQADVLGITVSDYVRRRLFEIAPRLNELEEHHERLDATSLR